jgi:hypothetical protein
MDETWRCYAKLNKSIRKRHTNSHTREAPGVVKFILEKVEWCLVKGAWNGQLGVIASCIQSFDLGKLSSKGVCGDIYVTI